MSTNKDKVIRRRLRPYQVIQLKPYRKVFLAVAALNQEDALRRVNKQNGTDFHAGDFGRKVKVKEVKKIK